MEGARAYIAAQARTPTATLLTETLGFTEVAEGEYRLDGDERHFHWGYDAATQSGPAGRRHRPPHRLALARRRPPAPGSSAPPRRACTSRRSIDRDYFNAIYFRQPQGILFEIATTSPGFAVDEDPEHLGEELRLPSQHEHLRPQLEQLLTPLSNPRAARARGGVAMSALTYRERPAAGDPAGLLVLHHGRGADEHDLLGLADVARPAAPPARRHARARR